MNDHYDKSANLRQENENLTQKIKQFYDEYKNRETVNILFIDLVNSLFIDFVNSYLLIQLLNNH